MRTFFALLLAAALGLGVAMTLASLQPNCGKARTCFKPAGLK